MASETEDNPGALSGAAPGADDAQELYAKVAPLLDEAYLADDMRFFAATGRSFRLRPSSILEDMDGGAPFCLAVKTGPKTRLRRVVNLDFEPDGSDWKAFDTEAKCAALFRFLQGTVGGVN